MRNLEKIRDEIIDEAYEMLDALDQRDVAQCMAAGDQIVVLAKELLGSEASELSNLLRSVTSEPGFWKWCATAFTQWIEARAVARKAMGDAGKE